MSTTKTLLAAAVLFALAACQQEPVGNHATAAAPLAGSAQDDQDPPDPQPVPPDDQEDEDEDRDDDDARPTADDVAASPAQATEHADAAATDALIDTRKGGNPLVDPAMPVEPIAETDEDEDDDEDKR